MGDSASDVFDRITVLRKKFRPSGMNEILPFLFLGSLSDALSSDQLDKHKIKAIVTIRESDTPKDIHSKLKVMAIQLCDRPTDEIAAHFKDISLFIHDCRIRKEAVLVHCLAGVSRSATIVAAYLMIVCNLTSYNSLSYISSRRPKINPNFGFRMQLCKFEKSGAERDRALLIDHFGMDVFEKQSQLDQYETRSKYLTQCSEYPSYKKLHASSNDQLPSDPVTDRGFMFIDD